VAEKSEQAGAVTLAIDVGGTGLKAAVLDEKGAMLSERAKIETPADCTPELLVSSLQDLVKPLPQFDRVSVGFPGVVRDGVIRTAPNLGTDRFRGFDLAAALKKAFGVPVRVLNDADVQGFAAIHGSGVEMVITLGTGFGTSIFHDGRIAPHLEISQHPFRKGETYDEQLGQAARKEIGNKRWNKRVKRAIETLGILVNFDHLYIGGGNAKHIKFELPDDCSVVDNTAGILGGIKLWAEP
jgi:polyphosphate glucokinase